MTHRPRPRGFATVIAVFMVGLVTAAVATLVAGRTADARRTRAVLADAQFRQLLLAVAFDAPARVADAAATRWSIALPADAAGYTVEVRVTARSADHMACTATAGDGHRTLSERMEFALSDSHWRPRSITLEGGQ